MSGCALPTAVEWEEQRQLNSKDVLGDARYFLQELLPSHVLSILAHCPMRPLPAAGVSLFYFIILF